MKRYDVYDDGMIGSVELPDVPNRDTLNEAQMTTIDGRRVDLVPHFLLRWSATDDTIEIIQELPDGREYRVSLAGVHR